MFYNNIKMNPYAIISLDIFALIITLFSYAILADSFMIRNELINYI